MLLKLAFEKRAADRVMTVPDTARPWLVVFGAPVRNDAAPPLLQARLDRAATAFAQGAAARVLITGDDGRFRCDEVGVMRRALVDAGVPQAALIVDGGAHRTLASLVRARDRFGVRSAFLVSQPDHLWRALWQADVLDIDAAGLAAATPDGGRRRAAMRQAREAVARARALADLYVLRERRG